MDLSCIISDIIQSAVTKGASDVTVSVFCNKETKVKIECKDFVFPAKANELRSFGYEYIFDGNCNSEGGILEFVSSLPVGRAEDFCVSIMSANPKLEEFRLVYTKDDNEYVFSRNETLVLLGDVFIGEYNVLMWIEEEIRTKTEAL